MGLISTILLWLLAIALAIVLLVLVSLYIRGAFRWRPLVFIENAIAPKDDRFPLTIASLSKSISTAGQIVGFWNTAQTIQQARLDAINSARYSIQFETFMMMPGRRAQDFAAAVTRKAAEGIDVQVMIDSMGGRSIPDKYWSRLRSAGVQLILFNPFDWRAPANFSGRTHRKLLIIDSQKVLIGGAGMCDLWDGTEKSDDTKPWLDMEVALTGEVVSVMAAAFQEHWQRHRKRDTAKDTIAAADIAKFYPPADLSSLPTATNKESTDEKSTDEKSLILVTLGSRPSYRASSIEMLKQTLIASAQQRIWLSSPYFLPNESTRQLLIRAKQSGIDVRILTTSARSDKKPVYYASYEVYGPLLEAGVQIFEYQPSMLHAKMLIIDQEWVNTGSANFDYRSFLHNDELDILVNSSHLVQCVEGVFDKGFAESQQIGLRQWQYRSWLKHRLLGNAVRLVQWQL
ncbi:MAG: phospholipase D-like domain-containing protein [Phormidesmis sp.]